VGTEHDVHFRERQPVVAAELEEEVFEVTAGAGIFGAVKGEGSLELGAPRSANARDCLDRVEVHEVEEVGLGDCFPHPRHRRDRCEVEEGPRHRRHRQAPVLHPLEALGPVDADLSE